MKERGSCFICVHETNKYGLTKKFACLDRKVHASSTENGNNVRYFKNHAYVMAFSYVYIHTSKSES